MPEFKQCCVCRLSLPANMIHSILASFKGKEIKVDICDRCKEIKMKESIENTKGLNHKKEI